MSDDASPRLGLPYVAAGQAQKHVTVNAAFARLDGLVQTAVVSRTTAAQPAAPDDGALYILPDAATGAVWGEAGAGTLMRYEAGGWARIAVSPGQIAWVADEAIVLVHDGDWRPLTDVLAFPSLIAASTPHGARIRLALAEEDLMVSGASTATSIVIPARAIVLSVATRTLTTVTGASAYDCGVAGETSKFGGSLGVTAGASNIGVIGPTAVYADTPVLLTAIGPAFSGGQVRVAIAFIAFDAPSA
ncbi:MAG: DUF2793 domain-containing protein [Caulobacter sp.]|nr:DUF2793 domain-containing protein [Caulobacter sp.]